MRKVGDFWFQTAPPSTVMRPELVRPVPLTVTPVRTSRVPEETAPVFQVRLPRSWPEPLAVTLVKLEGVATVKIEPASNVALVTLVTRNRWTPEPVSVPPVTVAAW